jgi:hypothetical protein
VDAPLPLVEAGYWRFDARVSDHHRRVKLRYVAMYIVPLIVIILLAIVAVAWTPIFAVIIFAIFFVLFLAYVGLSRRADQGAAGAREARPAERGPQEGTDPRIR